MGKLLTLLESPKIFKLKKIGANTVIAYTYNHSEYYEIPLSPELASYIGTSNKVYVRAKLTEDNYLEILERVENQKW